MADRKRRGLSLGINLLPGLTQLLARDQITFAAQDGYFQVVIGRRTPGWPPVAAVMPADRTSGRLQAGAIVVHLRDPGNPSCLSMAALRSELGLTLREATLVRELAEGATLVQAAGRMAISTGTARQYLKAVFLKTGVGGQADLLRLVAR